MTLALAGVSRAFGGVRAVDDATFTVGDGEVHGLIGPNGAGKTTLLNLISGLLRPTAGKIELDGRRIDSLPPNRIAERLDSPVHRVADDVAYLGKRPCIGQPLQDGLAPVLHVGR